MIDSDMEVFFDAAKTTIQDEEFELNRLFEKNSNLYEDHHHGVCNLYETTFAYLLFKELLRRQFVFKVHWEYPYPYSKTEHCDLALINSDDTLEAFIELKIWSTEDDNAIKADIKKLKGVTGCKKYIFIIGYGGDIKESDEYLTRDNLVNHYLFCDTLKTKYHFSKPDCIRETNLNLFMYEVK